MNDFYGKYFIVSDGSIIDCSTSEHARFARARMLGIPSDDICKEIPMKDIFKPLTADQFIQYRDRGLSVEQDAVTFLRGNGRDPVDPRVYCLKNYGWIRTVENKFYAWDWDKSTIGRLIESDDFWRVQRIASWGSLFDLISVKHETTKSINFYQLKHEHSERE